MKGHKAMSKKKYFRDEIGFPIWATFFTVLGVLILCGLGTWQLKRLAWKTNIIQNLEQEYNRDVKGIYLSADMLEALGDDVKRGQVRGRYLPDKELLLQPRTYDGKAGYHIITPFELQRTGQVILVNRGWIPMDYDPKKIKISDHTFNLMVDGGLVLTGMSKTFSGPNYFTPPNNPKKGQWFSLSVEEISKAKGIENMLPVVFYLEKKKTEAPYPKTDALRQYPPNNHFEYSIFWYLMAFTMVSVYIGRFFFPHHHERYEKRRSKEEDE